MRCRLTAFAIGIAALALAGPAAAAFTVTTDVARNPKPQIRVAENGDAEIAWTSKAGTRATIVVPLSGKVRPGTTISGKDVSKPASAPGVPFLRQSRQTADGTTYAIQLWASVKGGPLELRFARWQGDPTEVELETEVADTGKITVIARATFAGKPVVGTSPTPGGQRVGASIVLDCSGCPAAGGATWGRMLKLTPKGPRGEARVLLRDEWLGTSVRAIAPGPNRGTQYAPDGLATVDLPT